MIKLKDGTEYDTLNASENNITVLCDTITEITSVILKFTDENLQAFVIISGEDIVPHANKTVSKMEIKTYQGKKCVEFSLTDVNVTAKTISELETRLATAEDAIVELADAILALTGTEE